MEQQIKDLELEEKAENEMNKLLQDVKYMERENWQFEVVIDVWDCCINENGCYQRIAHTQGRRREIYATTPTKIIAKAKSYLKAWFIVCHEVGHYFTLKDMELERINSSGSVGRYKTEVIASKWALNYLVPRVSPSLYRDAVNWYNECLEGYYGEAVAGSQKKVKKEVLK